MKVKQYLELGADAAAPAAARDKIADALSGRDEDSVQAAALVVSELVSNAVLHGSHNGDSVGVEFSVAPDRIRIEVIDPGEGFTVGERRRSGGFGLKIVADLAETWGVERGPPHKVWCELTTR